MKAMIFAAGLGTRLKPLTDHMPKALVPVAGRPMLEHVILKLKEAGFTELVINIHHFGEQIIDFLKANQNFGLTIHISDERDRLLDTGGGIKKAATFFTGTEPFLVHNVDILSNADLKEVFIGRARIKLPCWSARAKLRATCCSIRTTVCRAGFIKTRCKPSRKVLCTNRANTANMRSAASM